METKDIIILAACLLAAGFSLYRKYMKNKATGSGGQQSTGTGSITSASSKDDDYEPYSGNKS